ncbi:MAG: hypothetical protein ABI643_02180 [Candidatus Doudnabacteria bacterium]
MPIFIYLPLKVAGSIILNISINRQLCQAAIVHERLLNPELLMFLLNKNTPTCAGVFMCEKLSSLFLSAAALSLRASSFGRALNGLSFFLGHNACLLAPNGNFILGSTYNFL